MSQIATKGVTPPKILTAMAKRNSRKPEIELFERVAELPSEAATMTRVSVGLARTGGAKAAAVMAAPDELGQLLGHVEARMTGRLTLDARRDLPTLLQVKTRRLKMHCG